MVAEMELRHLRYFVRVAEEENVSRAALKLHVSQPALSRQMRDLEEDIGVSLFARNAKSVRLTEAGRVFLSQARAVLQRANEAIEKARAAANAGQGEIHVGYAPSLTARILPETLRAFQGDRPGIRVRLHDLSTEEMIAGVCEGKLQLAFAPKPSRKAMRGLKFEELVRDSICIAVATKHPLARRRSLTVAEVAREPLIAYNRTEYPEAHELLANVFAGIKTRWRVTEEHDSVSALIAAVEAGNGIAVVVQSLACTAGERLKLLPLVPAPQPLSVGAIWAEAGLTPQGERFLRSAKEACLKNVGRKHNEGSS
jgi:LysR family transcriptional regulator, benzoate and cis,cis-muconate-responsive activator of ben and cat genes